MEYFYTVLLLLTDLSTTSTMALEGAWCVCAYLTAHTLFLIPPKSGLTPFLFTIIQKVMKGKVTHSDGFTVIGVRGLNVVRPPPCPFGGSSMAHTTPEAGRGELAVNPGVTVAPPSHHPSGTLTQRWQSAACDVVPEPVYSLETH